MPEISKPLAPCDGTVNLPVAWVGVSSGASHDLGVVGGGGHQPFSSLSFLSRSSFANTLDRGIVGAFFSSGPLVRRTLFGCFEGVTGSSSSPELLYQSSRDPCHSCSL